MFELTIRTDVDAFLGQMSDIQKAEMPGAIKYAVVDTAKDVIPAEQASMRSVFDKPTDWTLKSLAWSMNRDNVSASVFFKDGAGSAGRYLQPQIDGGPRGHTGFEFRLISTGLLSNSEYLVPGRFADRDGNGNLVPGQITKILSDLGGLAGMADKSKYQAFYRNRGRRKAEQYVLVRGPANIPAGIYLAGGGKIASFKNRLVFLITKAPAYHARYPFKAVAEATIALNFARHFRDRLAAGVAHARRHGNNMKAIAA